MIKLYGFGNVHEKVIGETRDLRVYWALEEMNIPYEVIGIDHTAGEHKSAEYSRRSYFNQIPTIEDEGFILSESASILLYIAEKYKKLIPENFEGKTRVTQWSFVALTTVEPPLAEIQMIYGFFGTEKNQERLKFLIPWAHRVLSGIEDRLSEREWIATDEFSVADILLICVLREVRHRNLLDNYPHITNYYNRGLKRPAWKKALLKYAETLGVDNKTMESKVR